MSSPVTIQPIPKTYLDTDNTLSADSDVKVPTQKAVKAYVASSAPAPTVATGAEVDTGTDNTKMVTPKAIEDSSYAKTSAIPVKASGAEVLAGSDDAKFVTAKALADAGIPKLIASPADDHTASSNERIALTAGTDLNFGDVGYIKSDGKVGLIDADAIATMSGLVMCIDASIANNASGTFMFMGVARDDTWNWTIGGLIYGTVTATTGNTLSQTAPTGTDDVVQILGVALTADIMVFKPQLVQTELV